MLNFVLVLFCTFFMSGCSEQRPAQVVAARPSIFYADSPVPLLADASQGKNSSNSTLNLSKQPAVKVNSSKYSVERWGWPAQGAVITRFSNKAVSFKGIDIANQEGTPVLAAADGEVVYSGHALKGYGNLLIIKHDKNYLTAYAHNRRNLVKEGDRVALGQRIAEMGRTGTDKVKLHFEVRYQGKPVDPQQILPSRN